MMLQTATRAKVHYAIFHLKEKQHLHLQSDFSEVILLCSAVKIQDQNLTTKVVKWLAFTLHLLSVKDCL